MAGHLHRSCMQGHSPMQLHTSAPNHAMQRRWLSSSLTDQTSTQRLRNLSLIRFVSQMPARGLPPSFETVFGLVQHHTVDSAEPSYSPRTTGHCSSSHWPKNVCSNEAEKASHSIDRIFNSSARTIERPRHSLTTLTIESLRWN